MSEQKVIYFTRDWDRLGMTKAKVLFEGDRHLVIFNCETGCEEVIPGSIEYFDSEEAFLKSALTYELVELRALERQVEQQTGVVQKLEAKLAQAQTARFVKQES